MSEDDVADVIAAVEAVAVRAHKQAKKSLSASSDRTALPT
jgi:hypothetical protein